MFTKLSTQANHWVRLHFCIHDNIKHPLLNIHHWLHLPFVRKEQISSSLGDCVLCCCPWCVCQGDCVVLLWSEHAAISLRPAKVSGNAAVPPGLSEWSHWAETNAGGGAFLRLYRWPCESCIALWSSCECAWIASIYLKVFFVHTQYSPSVTAVIEILSNKVQIYSSHLYIHAHFSGLR